MNDARIPARKMRHVALAENLSRDAQVVSEPVHRLVERPQAIWGMTTIKHIVPVSRRERQQAQSFETALGLLKERPHVGRGEPMRRVEILLFLRRV